MAWYRHTFLMKHKYNWSIEECEALYPFEMDVYTGVLLEWLEMEKTLAEERRSMNAA
jgi:hypothetical protein